MLIGKPGRICYRKPEGGGVRRRRGGGGVTTALHRQIELIRALVAGPRGNVTEAVVLERHQAFSVVLADSPYLPKEIARALEGLKDLYEILPTPAIRDSLIDIFRQAATVAYTNRDLVSAAGSYSSAGGISRETIDYLAAGEYFEIAESYPAAGEAFENAYKVSQDLDLLVRAARCFAMQEGYGKDVARCLEKAARESEGKDAMTLWKWTGDAYKSIGKNREAGFAYGQAAELAKGEEKIDLRLLAGEQFLAGGMSKEAHHCFCQVSRDRRPPEFYALAEELFPETAVPKPLSRGAALEEQGKACEGAEARGFYKEAAKAFAGEGEHREAAHVYLKAARLADGVNKTHLLTQAARQFVLARSYGKALTLLEEAVEGEGNGRVQCRYNGYRVDRAHR